MAIKITTRRFTYQTSQQARTLLDAAATAEESMCMAEALRRAEGDNAGADATRHELGRATQ